MRRPSEVGGPPQNQPWGVGRPGTYRKALFVVDAIGISLIDIRKVPAKVPTES
jgi:hypothetical protein